MHQAVEDDLTISDGDKLLRRIPSSWRVRDHSRGSWRPTSQAFNDHPNGSSMSVHLLCVLEQSGNAAESVLEGHEGFGLVAITVKLVRDCGQAIRRVPAPNDPAHAEVVGPKTQSVRRRLARGATWLVEPKE